MKKGIVMEMDNAFLTLLTPEGEFLRARRLDQPYAIGEEIHFFPIENVNTPKSFYSLKNIFKEKSVWAVMVALFIFLGSFIPMYQDNKAYAYMSIDVNPSIELGVNKDMQVVELTGFNKEGKKIISQLDNWKKKDVYEITQIILAEIKKEGFFKEKKRVVIATVRTKELEEKVEKKLQKNIESIKETVNNQQLELTVLTGTEKELEKAHELGITTGKYQENKIQSTNNQNSIEKTKENEKMQDRNGNSSHSSNYIPPEQFKEQTENSRVQDNRREENKKQTENNRWDGKSMPPGQLKKMEEEALKQNQGEQKRQYYQKEKSQENYNSKQNEKNNEKQNEKNYEKQNEKNYERHNENNYERHNWKNNNNHRNN
jgi:hypothetical protein